MGRSADEELYEGLVDGQYCYVLTSRQMGKSSLMLRTRVRLMQDGARVVPIDLTRLGLNITAEQWYFGLVDELGRRLGFEMELENLWDSADKRSPLQKWCLALEWVLDRLDVPLVVMVDEVDVVRSLPFSTDEFFASIREFYNRRADGPRLERLVFCIFGVALPSDLIDDPRTTPFNIGRRIELTDFTPKEADGLLPGLGSDARWARAVLKRTMYWTHGHPYLTQSLCSRIADGPRCRARSTVDRQCRALFFDEDAKVREDNLSFVSNVVLRFDEFSGTERAALLETYAQVLRGERPRDKPGDPVIAGLRLAGLVRAEDGGLRSRNRIYEKVFDTQWVETHLPDGERRRREKAVRRARLEVIRSTAIVILALLGFLGTILYQGVQRRHDLYIARMNQAKQAWDDANLGRVRELLEPYESGGALTASAWRGFEWYHLDRLSRQSGPCQTFPYGLTEIKTTADGGVVVSDQVGFVHFLDAGLTSSALPLTPQILGIGSGTAIDSVDIAPDGRLLAVAANPAGLRMCDTGARSCTDVATSNEDHFLVALSPDGAVLAFYDQDAGISIARVSDGSKVASAIADGAVLAMSFSHDGRYLFFASERDQRGTVAMWEFRRGSSPKTLPTHGEPVSAIAVSDQDLGSLLAIGTLSGSIEVREYPEGRLVAHARAGNARVNALAFSPGARYLAAGLHDHTVFLWQMADPSERRYQVLKGHSSVVSGVAFSPDGAELLSASWDKTICRWDVSRAYEPWLVQQPLDEANAARVAIAWAGTGHSMLVTAGWNGMMQVWDAGTRAQLFSTERPESITALDVAPDGRHAAIALHPEPMLAEGGRATVELWDLQSRSLVAKLPVLQSKIQDVAFSYDGRTLATAGFDGQVRLWDLTHIEHPRLQKQIAHDERVYSVEFSRDGLFLASADLGDTVKIYDLTHRTVAATLGVDFGGEVVAFSPDGKRLAAGGRTSHEVRVLELTGAAAVEEYVMKMPGHRIMSIAFSPDGTRLAAGSHNRLVLWELSAGRQAWSNQEHGYVDEVSFSPDGLMLAVSVEGSVFVRSAERREEP